MTRSLGLDGTIVAQTRLGLIDGTAGQLHYCGYNVHDLADHLPWEAVLHLLWYGELPDSAALHSLRTKLAELRRLSDDELALVRSLPTSGHGMDVLRAALNLLAGLHRPGVMRPATLVDDGLRLTAKFPILAAAWARHRQGLEPVQPDGDLGHGAAFLMALHGRRPEPLEAAAFNCYMVLLAEHGLNVSTFVARVAASAQNDLYAAIDAALATLKGVAHGGANEMAMRQFLAIASPERVEVGVADLLARKERLMGVGHRIYTTEDPRVRHLRQHSAALAQRPGADPSAHTVAEAVAAHVLAHPHFQARKLFPNVEFYSAPLLYQLGLPLDLFTAAFAMARMPGWIGHIREQLDVARLVRPEAEYIGPAVRPLVLEAQL